MQHCFTQCFGEIRLPGFSEDDWGSFRPSDVRGAWLQPFGLPISKFASYLNSRHREGVRRLADCMPRARRYHPGFHRGPPGTCEWLFFSCLLADPKSAEWRENGVPSRAKRSQNGDELCSFLVRVGREVVVWGDTERRPRLRAMIVSIRGWQKSYSFCRSWESSSKSRFAGSSKKAP